MKAYKILIGLILLIGPFSLKSQNESTIDLADNSNKYKNAIGLRGGYTSGLTFKHFISEENSLDFILGIWNRQLSVTGLYEWNQNAFNVAGLNWYYGMGGHVSIWDRNNHHHYPDDRGHNHLHDDGYGIGVDGVLGIEYKIHSIPFALSLDVKPFTEVTNDGHIWWSIDPGIGIKVTF